MVDEEYLGVELIREMSRDAMAAEIKARHMAHMQSRLALSSDKELRIELINLRMRAYQERIVREAGLSVNELGIVVDPE